MTGLITLLGNTKNFHRPFLKLNYYKKTSVLVHFQISLKSALNQF